MIAEFTVFFPSNCLDRHIYFKPEDTVNVFLLFSA